MNGPFPGSGGPSPSGPWDLFHANWSPDPGGGVLPIPWLPGSTAVFAAGGDAVAAYDVTIPPGTFIPGVAGIIFEEGTATIDGGGIFDLVAPFIITPIFPSTHTIEVDITGPLGVGLVKAGPGTLILEGANLYMGGTTIDEGVLSISDDDNLGTAGFPLTFDGGELFTGPAVITSARDVTVLAGGGVITNGFPLEFMGETFGGPGDLTKSGAGELKVKHVRTASLSITAGAGTVKVDDGAVGDPDGVSNVTALTLDGGATPTVTLDITNNGFVVNYSGASPFETIKAQIISAFEGAGGPWTGDGITSTTAVPGVSGIGYAESTALYATFPADFLGQSVDDTAVLLRYTLLGDANLDGMVDLDDFNILAANFGFVGLQGAVWSQADFNYDGRVNLEDFNRLAANFGMAASPDGPTPADWAALAAAVPEPASLGALFSGAIGLLARRRESCVTLPV